MKYFIDTEFHEFKKKPLFSKPIDTIELISIGIVAEDGREYYAISKDFDIKAAWNNEWLRENVLINIHYELSIKETTHKLDFEHWKRLITMRNGYSKRHYKTLKTLISKFGKSNKQIAQEIKDFVAERDCTSTTVYPKESKKEGFTVCDYNYKNVEFYGYYSDYDWVVFCWLFGRMIDLPKGFPMYCIDLKQELDRKASTVENISFNYSDRIEELVLETLGARIIFIKNLSNYPKQVNEHNALTDARWNFELYKFLQTI